MWKEEITEYSTVIVFCRLTWLHARITTWIRLSTMHACLVPQRRETTGRRTTMCERRTRREQVAICIGETKLTTHARSFLSIEKPPTLRSAASHTGSTVS